MPPRQAGGQPLHPIYAVHDALVKPMPGGENTPSLAESWTVSKDGLAYEFVLRKGAKFQNGDPVTADDVKFSFERYKSAAAKLLKDRVRDVDPGRVRFHLREPWPDFMTFYGTSATGAAWIVPRKYVEKVGEDGFKKAPIGAGPYKVVSFNPGIDLVMEAFEGYWRKVPSVKRLVFRSMPDETTRAAALKAGDVDIVYLLSGPTAQEVKRTPGLRLAAAMPPGVVFLDLPEQWDPKSPWHDRRVRLAASHAPGPQRAQPGGDARPLASDRGSHPTRSRFRAGLPAARLRPRPGQEAPRRGRLSQRLRRGRPHPVSALLLAGRGDRRLSPGGGHPHAAAHHGARRLSHRVARAQDPGRDHGPGRARRQRGHPHRGLRDQERLYSSGVVPEIETLFERQARELDRKKREGMLHQIQQIMHDRVMHVPVYELAFLWGIGPRVEEACVDHIKGFSYSAPYEDLRLKAKR